MVSNKKGMQTIWIILATAVVAFVAAFFMIGGSQKAFAKSFKFTGVQFDSLGDCDNDNDPNFRDECPCLKSGGFNNKNYVGCPEKTTSDQADNDKKTCLWFVSELTECSAKDMEDGKCYLEEKKDETKGGAAVKTVYVPGEVCEEDEKKCKLVDGNPRTRCEQVKRMVKAEGVVAEEGVICDCDFSISAFNTFENDVEKPVDLKKGYEASLGGSQEYLNFPVNVKIVLAGKGLSSTAIPARLKFYVCEQGNQNCQPKSYYDLNGNSYSSMGFNDMKDGTIKVTGKRFIRIGTDGDACDGPETKHCYLKVVIDDDKNYQERDENNNEFVFNIKLTGQYSTASFGQAKVVLFSTEKGCGNEYNADVEKTCLGTLDGGASVSACAQAFDVDEEGRPEKSDDGSFPRADAEGGKCWIFSKYVESGDDDLASLAFAPGTIIDSEKYSKFKPQGVNFDDTRIFYGYSDCPFTFGNWRKPGSSLICHQGMWHFCGSTAAGKRIQNVNNLNYLCQATHWVEDLSEAEREITKFKVIEIELDGGSCGDETPSGRTVSLCGDDSVKKCKDSFSLDQGKVSTTGALPESEAPWDSCWVFSKEIDEGAGDDDLGAAYFSGGFYIAAAEDAATKIMIHSEQNLYPGSDDDAKCLLNMPGTNWNNPSIYQRQGTEFGGGLLCKKGEWYLCDQSSLNQKVVIDRSRAYTCKNYEWELD